MTAVLAVDQGTSGTKAVVVDPVDGVVAVADVVVHPVHLAGGGVEQDPQELWESVLAAGHRALELAGRPVGAVALANQGETVLAWDPDTGRPLTPALVWQDHRSEALCNDLAEHREWVAARTGLVLDPYFSAPKMAWLRRHLTTEGVVTTTDTWLLHRLTGEFVTDVSTASRSLLVDLDTATWDPDLVSLFGLDGEPLPRIAACDELVGETSAFGPSLPVGGLLVDQQAALLGQGCLQAGEAKCTFGTGAFLLANTGAHPTRSTAGLTTSVAWRLRDATSWCLDGQVFTAGSAVTWLQELGLVGRADELDATAADGAGSVVCVPALAGLGAPWWRPDATATFTGMTLSTRPGHLVAAVLQGIAAQVAELVDLVGSDLGTPLTTLRVDGGLTASSFLMQATADLTGVPVDVSSHPHATAVGAAVAARLATEPSSTPEDAVPPWTPSARFEPRWSDERRAAFRHDWRAAAGAGDPS